MFVFLKKMKNILKNVHVYENINFLNNVHKFLEKISKFQYMSRHFKITFSIIVFREPKENKNIYYKKTVATITRAATVAGSLVTITFFCKNIGHYCCYKGRPSRGWGLCICPPICCIER